MSSPKYRPRVNPLNLEAAVLGVHSCSRAGARAGARSRAGGRRSFLV